MDASGYIISTSITNHVGFGMVKYNQVPFSEQENNILTRFAKVFDQSYTRFLDLQKAEAQADEARIENALEKVRSRSLAMHKSNELQEVVNTVYDRLIELEVNMDSANFIILSEGKRDFDIWLAAPKQIYSSRMHIPEIDYSPTKEFFDAREKGKYFLTMTCTFEEKNRWLNYAFEHTGLSQSPPERKKFVLESKLWTVSWAISKYSALQINSYSRESFSERENAILKRFGKVFEQAYIRFLDLQKAEAQVREAQIETALERVRARTMGMHKSSELFEIVNLLYFELSQLDVELARVVLLTINKEMSGMYWWMSNPEMDVKARGYFVPDNELPMTLSMINAWENKLSEWCYDLKGKDKKQYDKFLFSKSELAQLPIEIQNAMASLKQVYCSGYCNNFGILTTSTLAPLSITNTDLLARFGRVFEQTYTRFLDLQKAEAQAREAIKQASLDRVRGEIASMRSKDDLDRITPLVWQELTTLGVPFFRCGVFIINEEEQMVHAYLSTPDGKALGCIAFII